MTLAVKRESAMKPPLANAGFEQKSISVAGPWTSTRRTGDACEVAQNSPNPGQPVLPATSIRRFDSERQKLTSAVQLPVASHWLNASTVPLIVTSSGDAPSPATSV
jgi:hypothetical protein